MEIKSKFRDTANQIYAIVEKDLKLKLRFKSNLLLRLVSPFISIIMPLIVMGQIFALKPEFGPWNGKNYFVFQFVASQLYTLFGVRNAFPGNLKSEKFWYTLQALIIAPFKRINLLIGYYVTHMIVSSTAFIFFFILCYVVVPISITTIIGLFFTYFLLSLAFSGIGLIIGIFSISKENWVPFLNFGLNLFFLFSTLNLPFEFFPSFIQNIIDLNPLFYVVNFSRLVWIENNFIYSIMNHPISFIVVIISGVLLPILGLNIFNYIFDKYGIVGY